MIVDDEPDVLETIGTIIEHEGYEIVKVKNGQDCLEKIEKKIPDLILLDIMMPGLTAREVVNGIYKKKKFSKIKIIYVTAVDLSEKEKKDLLKQKQVIAFIQKPFKIEEITSNVRKALK